MSTIGGKIDALHALREEKKELLAQLETKEKELEAANLELIDLMDAQGVTSSTGTKATVTIGISVKPSVDDWDAFYAFIQKNKYWHLLERRPSVTGCRELFDTKGKIPGVVPFTQRTVRTRTL